MSLPRFSINQSLFVNLISVIIVIIGTMVLFGMNREVFPNVTFDIVSVTTVYPGATPLDVEKLISVPLEKEIKEVDGIKEIKSSSFDGISSLTIKLDPNEKDKDKVVNDIKSAVDRVKDLPKDIYEDPVVTEITSKQYPIIEVSLAGDMTEWDLRKYADALEDILENVDGVAKISKSGYRDREVKIEVNPALMKEYYVSMDEVSDALAGRNVSVPAGEINTATNEYSVRTTGEFETAKDIEDVIIRANDAGNWLRVKDIAVVDDSFKKEEVLDKTWGKKSINLVVLKKESGDALTVVDQVKIASNGFIEKCPGLKVAYVNDYSFFARRRLNVLKNNGWLGLLIVIGVMLLFLQKRVAIVTVLGIPIAFFTTFIFMSLMGITINLISMFGLIIVLGMLVDDGIIVAENSYRYMEEGMSPREATVKGTEEVMGAVVTAIFTTIASFAPLLFMTGIMGKFIRNIPTVLIIALLASLAEALIILPSHLADFVKIKKDADGKPISLSKDYPWFKTMVKGYTKMVSGAVKHKYLVVMSFVAVLIFCIFLAVNVMKFVLFPSAGINYFFIRVEAPIGTPLEKTNELIEPLEKIVNEIPSSELESFVTNVGHISEDRNDPFAGTASNLAQIAAYLTPEQDRKRDAEEIIEELRLKCKDIKGFEELRFDKATSGPPVGKAVEAKIRGESFETLDKIAFEYMDYLKSIEGTSDITWDHKPGKEEIRVKVDNNKATMAGLTVSRIARTVRAVFQGEIATKIKPIKAEEDTDVTVVFPKNQASDMKVFDNILVKNSYGNLIPLSKVAEIEKVPGTTTIFHLDGKRVITASCNVDNESTTSMKLNSMLSKNFKDIPDRYMGYSVKYGGEQEESLDSLVSLAKAYIFAFLIIYLMLASFFKSLVQPFVVMLAIPFGLIGVVLAFLCHGIPFSFMAILGVVGLNGIVVNDSIVLVDFINQLRRSGMERKESIIKAGQMRIRPVLLTTITTVGGLSTVAYGIGGKDPFLVPMALAISWGLLFATGLTLIVIPCFYSIIDDIAIKLTKHSSLVDVCKIKNCD
ncbi:MAG: efflux RND transporter permease subunit [Candidatus Omnitrophica bacterium]|nr:efflux RND transporter permease subunit [Candidatus Omnitrophota bacterium]